MLVYLNVNVINTVGQILNLMTNLHVQLGQYFRAHLVHSSIAYLVVIRSMIGRLLNNLLVFFENILIRHGMRRTRNRTYVLLALRARVS